MFLLIDKPIGVSSHFAVNKIRRITKIRKVGHGGTLDPLASGLLIIAIGRENTKKLHQLSINKDKSYVFTIKLGEETETDDKTGKIVKLSPTDIKPKIDEIENLLAKYIGKQSQIPPSYSAKKISGEKAYKISLRGEKPKLKASKIQIKKLEIINYKYPSLSLAANVSSGTYVRSLARDIGRDLKTFGHITMLRRTRIGEYDVEDSIKLEEINENNFKKYLTNVIS